MWVYRCYDDGASGNLWHRWFAQQDARTKAKHAVAFKFFESSTTCSKPYCRKLHGTSGLIEIRITTTKAHRIIGFAGPERMIFKIMLICNHKDDVYDPPDAIKIADKRKKEVEVGKRRVIDCVRPN